MNDAIEPSLGSVRYASFNSAIAMVASLGQGAWVAKCDIESAFRLLPVNPLDFNLWGFHLQGNVFLV